MKNEKYRTIILAAIFIVLSACLCSFAYVLIYSHPVSLELVSVVDAPRVDPSGSTQDPASGQTFFYRVGILFLGSLLTATVEEFVFRGILLRILLKLLGDLSAIWMSAVLFGAFHIVPGIYLGLFPEAVDVEVAHFAPFLSTTVLVLKFVQATLFGAVMAEVVLALAAPDVENEPHSDLQGGTVSVFASIQSDPFLNISKSFMVGLLVAIGLHALFDIIYFAAPVILSGDFPVTMII